MRSMSLMTGTCVHDPLAVHTALACMIHRR